VGVQNVLIGTVLSLLLHGVILALVLVVHPGGPRSVRSEPQYIVGELVSWKDVAPRTRPRAKSPPPARRATKLKRSRPKVRSAAAKRKSTRPTKTTRRRPRTAAKKHVKAAPSKKKPQAKRRSKAKAVALKTVKSPRASKARPSKGKAASPRPKRRVARATPAPPPPSEKGYEEARREVLEEMQRKALLRDIEKRVKGREVAALERSRPGRGTAEGGGGRRISSEGMAALARLFSARVHEEIRSSWGVPANIPMDGTLETVVLFRLDAKGVVKDAVVERSSGNPAFDQFCVQAVLRSSPLTPPPPELVEEVSTSGIVVTFRNTPT